MEYQVIVGNIGIIYDGDSYEDAITIYDDYVDASKHKNSRVAGENVTIMQDGDPMVEYFGDINND